MTPKWYIWWDRIGVTLVLVYAIKIVAQHRWYTFWWVDCLLFSFMARIAQEWRKQ